MHYTGGFYPANLKSLVQTYQPLQYDKACLDEMKTYHGPIGKSIRMVFNTLNATLPKPDQSLPGTIGWILNIYGYHIDGATGKTIRVGHTVVPYRIEQIPHDPTSYNILVYDSNHIGNPNMYLTFHINSMGATIDDYDLIDPGINYYNVPNIYAVDLNSVNTLLQLPTIPDHGIVDDLPESSHLLFTDNTDNKLGYNQGVFKSEINGACPITTSTDNGNNTTTLESYYVPDYSIKMELCGTDNGSSEISMMTQYGLITADVPVSPTSVYQFKVLNNGTGIGFIPENGTTPSLSLMLGVENLGDTQVVNASLSQIEVGGSLNLSNNNGTIIIQNNGLQKTGNFTIEQITSGQNSSISINNVVIEGNSIVQIVPSNWNDIANSTVTINDVGSNGQVYYTEIITYQNSQVIPTPITPAGTLNNVIYVNPGKPAEFLNNVIYVPTTHSRNSEHDNDRHYAGYVSDIVPVRTLIGSEPIPMMLGSEPGGYGSEPYGYSGEFYGTIGTPTSEFTNHRAKAHLSKHKHKNHSKHHKTGKNHSK